MTFGLFLLISAILWLLNTLNEEYTDSLKYPVKFTNLPKNIRLLEELPDNLYLDITGHGYDILSYKLNYSKPPILVNLNKNHLRQLNERHYYLLGSDLIPLAEKRIKGELELHSVSPDTIHFIVTHTEEKKVPVEIAFSFKTSRQYIATGEAQLDPDSIIIRGPIQLLEKIESVKTEEMEYKDIKENIDRYIPLQDIEGITIDPDRIHLFIPVEKFTQASISVSVKPINIPDSLTMTCIPNKVNLTFKVPLSKYKLIQASDFSVHADYTNAEESRIPLKLTNNAGFAQDIKMSENEITFILNKKSKE